MRVRASPTLERYLYDNSEEKPIAGRSRPSLARPWLLLLLLITLYSWITITITMTNERTTVLVSFGLGTMAGLVLDEFIWIRRRLWREGRYKGFGKESMYTALGISSLFVLIAARVYFAWSPDLARTGFVVVGGFGCVSISIAALILRVSPAQAEVAVPGQNSWWQETRTYLCRQVIEKSKEGREAKLGKGLHP
ncbi:hypothetical protein C8F01DRAFT_1127380 [Mycena amicta]|nr:hypothetical protein C8F01DRAFT_1127380 [Mycena amicta]